MKNIFQYTLEQLFIALWHKTKNEKKIYQFLVAKEEKRKRRK